MIKVYGIRGKGFYIWKVAECQGGRINDIVLAAVAAGIKHVYIKIADGAVGYNGDVRALVQALQAVGIEVWGWQYVYGYNPQAEARMAARRIRESGVTGFIVDAESEFKEMPNPAHVAQAYMVALRAEVGAEFPLALSSYRYPTLHRQFPFVAFLEYCDLNMPQVYWMYAHDPVQQLERCIDEYNALSIVRTMVPTGAAWRQGGWQPTTKDIQDFLCAAREYGLAGASFWDWQHAEAIPALWMAIHEYDWPVEEEPAPPEEPEIPEDDMAEVLEKLDVLLEKQELVLGNQALILVKLNADPEEPEPDPEPEPPVPPAQTYQVRVTRSPGANAFVEVGRNRKKNLPILGMLEPRVQYEKNRVLAVTTDQPLDVDGTYNFFRLAGSEHYLRADHVDRL